MKMKTILLNSIRRLLSDLTNKKTEAVTQETIDDATFSPMFKQTLIALGPLLLTISSGMTFGYSAILIPQLQVAYNGTFIINNEKASWIASMAALPMAMGSLIGGYFLGKLGRKTTHTISCLPMFIGWLLIYLANELNLILIGRFVTGLFTGILTAATGIYIAETSDPIYRGFLLAGISFSVALGLLLSHLLGTFLSWQTTALICSLLPLLSQIIILFTPESPTWLLSKGKIQEAKRSFYWCRGSSEETTKEFNIMLERQNNQTNQQNENFKEKLKDLLVPEFLKPLAIITVYVITKQWSGINAITFYSVSIMKDTIGHGIDEYLATLLVDFIRLFMSIIACFLLRKFKRRPLALISGIGTLCSLITLSSYNYLSQIYPNIHTGYISMTCLVCYIIFVSIGLVPLPSSMLGELFPLRHKNVGSGISSFIAFGMFFSVVKTVPSMFESYGPNGSFLIFSVVTFISTIFVYFCLPETKGRPLHEIEDSFKNKK